MTFRTACIDDGNTILGKNIQNYITFQNGTINIFRLNYSGGYTNILLYKRKCRSQLNTSSFIQSG